MEGKISKVEMCNIQSWKHVVFNLEEGINVFKARNETGKSVLFKVFRTMCFPKFYGRKVIIRRGCDQGKLILTMFNGSVIEFNVYLTSQTYTLHKDGSTQSWKQDFLPEEIREELNWFVDKDSLILLNLIDLEMSLPFITSSSKFNAQVLKFIVEHPELEEMAHRNSDLMGELEEYTSIVSHSLTKIRGKRSAYTPINTDAILNRLDTVNGLKLEMRGLLRIAKVVDTISSLKKPEKLSVDFELLERNFKVIEKFNRLGESLDVLHNTLTEKDKVVRRLRELELHKKDLEDKLGECPTCGSLFDKEG